MSLNFWGDYYSKIEALLYLLINAEQRIVDVTRNHDQYFCPQMCYITSVSSLSDVWGWSRKKVRVFLALLQSQHIIQYKTIDRIAMQVKVTGMLRTSSGRDIQLIEIDAQQKGQQDAQQKGQTDAQQKGQTDAQQKGQTDAQQKGQTETIGKYPTNNDILYSMMDESATERTPEGTLERTLEGTLERTLEGTPERTLEGTPERTLESIDEKPAEEEPKDTAIEVLQKSIEMFGKDPNEYVKKVVRYINKSA